MLILKYLYCKLLPYPNSHFSATAEFICVFTLLLVINCFLRFNPFSNKSNVANLSLYYSYVVLPVHTSHLRHTKCHLRWSNSSTPLHILLVKRRFHPASFLKLSECEMDAWGLLPSLRQSYPLQVQSQSLSILHILVTYNPCSLPALTHNVSIQ